jgi:hypothetical protein
MAVRDFGSEQPILQLSMGPIIDGELELAEPEDGASNLTSAPDSTGIAASAASSASSGTAPTKPPLPEAYLSVNQ